MVFKLCTFLLPCLIFALASGHSISKLNKLKPFYPSEKKPPRTTSTEPSNDRSELVTIPGDAAAKESTPVENYNPVTGNVLPINKSYEDIVRKCPDGQSSFIEKDLSDIINYFAYQMSLIETINGSYFELALSSHDKIAKEVDDYITKFGNKPKHVDHILDELAQTRIQQIEPLVKGVVSKKPEMTSLQEVHSQNKIQSNSLLEKFQKCKKICALNCDSSESELPIRKRSISQKITPSKEIYYCATVKEVKDKILSVLSQFKDDFTITLIDDVREVQRAYEENFEIMKSKLKEAAVQQFGAIMYGVLSLEDDYVHFLDLLRGENGINGVESQLSQIRKNNLQVDYKIEELKNYVEKYRKHCLSCDSKNTLRLRRDLLQEVPLQPELSNNVLEELLNAYIDKIKSDFKRELGNHFQRLHEIFIDQDLFIENALVNLQPIQNEIKESLNKEEQELNDLKKLAPESIMDELSQLNKNSILLLETLDETLTFIHNSI